MLPFQIGCEFFFRDTCYSTVDVAVLRRQSGNFHLHSEKNHSVSPTLKGPQVYRSIGRSVCHLIQTLDPLQYETISHYLVIHRRESRITKGRKDILDEDSPNRRLGSIDIGFLHEQYICLLIKFGIDQNQVPL